MVRKLRFRTGWSENCVFGPPGEPILSKILKNYFFMISFVSFNNVITFLKHLEKMTFLRLYLPLRPIIAVQKWGNSLELMTLEGEPEVPSEIQPVLLA